MEPPPDSPEGSVPTDPLLLELVEEMALRLQASDQSWMAGLLADNPRRAATVERLLPPPGDAEPAAAASMPGPGDVLGDFRIVRKIGAGGMGVVFEAEQVSLGRRVAVKMLAADVRSERGLRERFHREAQAAARRHHTNIVPVFGVGEQGDWLYYVMPLIPGTESRAELDGPQ